MVWGRLSIYRLGDGGWYVAHAPNSNIVKKNKAYVLFTNLFLLS